MLNCIVFGCGCVGVLKQVDVDTLTCFKTPVVVDTTIINKCINYTSV